MDYMVKCKCGTFRCEYNDFVGAALSRNAVIGYRKAVDPYTQRETAYCINADFRCWTCNRYFQVNQIRGKFSAKHVCGARCLASKGPTCECSCGGKNHGRNYA